MPVLVWKAPMRYYSMRDEAAFFGWLQAIPGVKAVRGIGRELHITVRSTRLSRESLLELIALYSRYHGRMAELAMFEHAGNASWFSDPTAPWHKAVFAKEAVRSSRGRRSARPD